MEKSLLDATYMQRPEGQSNIEATAEEQFGKPVFPPLTQVKLGPLNKSWQTTTFYESVISVESASKLACLPKQSSRRIIPKHKLTAVSFAHATNQGYIYKLISKVLIPFALLIFWSGVWGGCLALMINSAQGSSDDSQDSSGGDPSGGDPSSGDGKKPNTGAAVWWGLCTFLFIPICFGGCCIGQWVGFQYCMVHNVTLYETRDEIGDSWVATIWKYNRVLLSCLCGGGGGNPDKNVVICSLVLDEEPPTEQIMAYVYGTIKPELADRMHTLHRLQVDGVLKKVDGLGLDISGTSHV